MRKALAFGKVYMKRTVTVFNHELSDLECSDAFVNRG